MYFLDLTLYVHSIGMFILVYLLFQDYAYVLSFALGSSTLHMFEFKNISTSNTAIKL